MDKSTFIKIVMIALIIVAIFYQVKIVKMIYDKEEILNAEPLSYGARKYGIGECTCIISSERQIWFNQSASITKINQAGISGQLNQEINFSGLILK